MRRDYDTTVWGFLYHGCHLGVKPRQVLPMSLLVRRNVPVVLIVVENYSDQN